MHNNKLRIIIKADCSIKTRLTIPMECDRPLCFVQSREFHFWYIAKWRQRNTKTKKTAGLLFLTFNNALRWKGRLIITCNGISGLVIEMMQSFFFLVFFVFHSIDDGAVHRLSAIRISALFGKTSMYLMKKSWQLNVNVDRFYFATRFEIPSNSSRTSIYKVSKCTQQVLGENVLTYPHRWYFQSFVCFLFSFTFWSNVLVMLCQRSHTIPFKLNLNVNNMRKLKM